MALYDLVFYVYTIAVYAYEVVTFCTLGASGADFVDLCMLLYVFVLFAAGTSLTRFIIACFYSWCIGCRHHFVCLLVCSFVRFLICTWVASGHEFALVYFYMRIYHSAHSCVYVVPLQLCLGAFGVDFLLFIGCIRCVVDPSHGCFYANLKLFEQWKKVSSSGIVIATQMQRTSVGELQPHLFEHVAVSILYPS
jgi:hypothetical protein